MTATAALKFVMLESLQGFQSRAIKELLGANAPQYHVQDRKLSVKLHSTARTSGSASSFVFGI
jgi:hypothetical protein